MIFIDVQVVFGGECIDRKILFCLALQADGVVLR